MPTRQESIEKINDMIGDIKVAMLTTVDGDGDFHSRPMMTQERQFDGDVWFFASRTSDKVREIEHESSVNISYVEGGNFVSIAGQAEIVSDVQKKKDLWNPALKVWFEDGPESPDVVLIHVDAKSAQYWDTPDGMIGRAISVVKVLLTGEEDAAGDSAKVQYK
ncbi:MAG: pyridoxamine 5'-phosphate oxidase family protein [Aggregatilineales bacterium]